MYHRTQLASYFGILSLCRAFLIFIAALAAAGGAAAQTTSTTASDGITPHAMRPGAPAGSYPLSGFENVNLYNGNLSFYLPLVKIGGRGGAGHTVGLPLNIKGWSIRYSSTETTQTWTPTKSGFSESGSPYGMGRLIGRKTGFGFKNMLGCPPTNKRIYETTLTTLTFKSPDGTEYDLRDQLNGGQRLTVTGCPSFPYTGQSRGTVFVSADGSGATFVSDAAINDQSDIPTTGPRTFNPTGYLLLPNGTRYRIVGGGVESVRDRNGNLLTNGGFTDQLGRTVTVESGVSDPTHGLCDRITYSGYGNTPRTVYVTKTSLGSALRSGYALQSLYQLFPELNGALNSGSGHYNPTVVSAVVLPNGQSYVFKYNSYGELARVGLPTGGAVEYDMVAGSGVVTGHDSQGMAKEIYRRVAERRVYADGATLSGKTVYDAQESAAPSYIEERDYDASGALLGGRRHYYYNGTARHHLIRQVDWTGSPWETYPHWAEGREVRTEAFAPGGAGLGALLRTVSTAWVAGGTLGGFSVNPRVASVTTTLADSNLVTKQSSVNPQTGALGYDQYGNPTDVWEYDFGVGEPGALLRRTHTDYVTDSAYTSHAGAHLRSLPSAQQVYGVVGGAETLVAKSETLYDQYGLAGYPAISGWADPGTAARGNPTTQRAWLDTPTSWLETRASYDQVGNVVSATDARNNTATISYSDAFSDGVGRNTYAFPTGTTSAVPDLSNQRATNTPLTSSATYDYRMGLTASATDANGKTTYFQYNDQLERLTRVDRPDGGWTVYWYDRNAYGDYVGTRTAINASQYTEGYQFLDGLGRGVRSFQYDGSQWITSDTEYDALGRAWRVPANPYLSGGSGTPVNPSNHWVETTFDALGRATHVRTTADNAQVVTSYSGNTVTVTDQAGKQRRSVADALGRLTQVVEAPGAGTCQADGAGCATDYSYDALGNLRKVAQGGQTRYFMYDSLSRLVRARNPEQAVNGALALSDTFKAPDDAAPNSQWSLGYSYDANSNLYQRTDARNVTTTYQYDNLNRVKQTSYSDSTPMTLFTYDFATNGRGLFYADYESSTSGTINYVFAYDAAGRPTSRRTDFHLNGAGWVGFYPASREYDKAGNVTKQTYPSGRAVNYTQFDAAGRLKAVTGNLGDGVARTYATGRNLVTGVEEGIQYDPAGRILEEKYGTQTPLYHKRHYNARGQLYDVRLSSVAWHQDQWDWNRGALVNYYTQQGGWAGGASGTDNSGNVKLAQHWVPDGAGGYNWMNQYYEYDSLNRISYVKEQQNGGTYTGEQHYTYDRFGNRTINGALTAGAGINNRQFTVDAATNRLGVPSGQPGVMQYDAAGNLTNDTYTGAGARVYDAENRMTTAWGPGLYGGAYQNQYVYDAAGKRVRRKSESGEAWQVYGFDGELIAEYAVNGPASQPQKEYAYRAGELLVVAEAGGQARWLVPDHLGTPRMAADLSGSLAGVRRHDYLPFGEEVGATVGGRTTQQGYSQFDGVRQGFTGYEKDGETGLNFAQARYHSPAMGRFTSLDQPLVDQWADDPQSWNLYTYAGNNPLLFTDPTGMWKWVDPDNNGRRFLQWEEGDDWDTLADFLNRESGYNNRYMGDDLARADRAAVLGEGLVVDVAGYKPTFSNVRGLEDKSLGTFMGVLPAGRAAKAGGGVLSRLWNWVRGRGAKAATGGAAKRTIKEIAEELGYSPSQAVKRAVSGQGSREIIPSAERELAAKFYERVANEVVKGPSEGAARKLNLARAKYLREGGTPPVNIHNFEP